MKCKGKNRVLGPLCLLVRVIKSKSANPAERREADFWLRQFKHRKIKS